MRIMWSTNNVDSFLLSVFFFLTRLPLPSPPNYDSTRATFLKWRIYAENRICSMVKVSCDTILSLQLEEKKKGTAPWMIHVSRLSNRIDEFSEYEQMRKKGNPITYRRVETLRKFRICMETEDGEGGKIRFRICIRWREKLSKRIYYCVY